MTVQSVEKDDVKGKGGVDDEDKWSRWSVEVRVVPGRGPLTLPVKLAARVEFSLKTRLAHGSTKKWMSRDTLVGYAGNQIRTQSRKRLNR